MMNRMILCCAMVLYLCSCKKSDKGSSTDGFTLSFTVDSVYNGTFNYTARNLHPTIRFIFSAAVRTEDVKGHVAFSDEQNTQIAFSLSVENGGTVALIQPAVPLHAFSTYTVSITAGLPSINNGVLVNPVKINLHTGLDSTDKFPRISDDELLTKVQQQTFHYFWDFGHPVSGLARERNSSGDVVTTGGSGFGIMAIITAISRNFISRADGLSRISTITNFLATKVQRYHGAFPHWINGATGETVPFSAQDDGADIVETAYLMQGLLCARQFFNNSTDANEVALREQINSLWHGVEWNWFRKNNENVLYWHWSPNNQWAINMPVSGWNEALIVYVLAASDSDAITKQVYDEGWARSGAIRNNKSFFGVTLPLGPDLGGPLFFSHYSFLGINPHGLTDSYANYWTQDTAHARINFNYCVSNPKSFAGYSASCWGLTASDEQGGYSAHSPTNDNGTISPTAAISSLPYTPTESMQALRFFYYTLGDKVWGEYGFIDAFNLSAPWFASSYLAIDQGPEIVMIENYRTGLLWNLFMSCPEIKNGMTNLGFQSPNL